MRAAVIYFGHGTGEFSNNSVSGIHLSSTPTALSSWDSGFNRRSIKWQFLHMAWVDETSGKDYTRFLTIPAWLFVCLFATPPGAWAWQWRGIRKRQVKGHCLFCGYDLRATPDRCPECGAAIPVEVTV